MTPEEAEALRSHLAEALQGPVKLLTPLPRRVRLRLWFASRINRFGCRLVEHGHIRGACLLWRIPPPSSDEALDHYRNEVHDDRRSSDT